MKILFAGTPQVSIPSLSKILDSKHEVVGVLTRADARIGRKKILTPSPVAQYALSHDIPIIYAHRITPEIQEQLSSTGADLGVVVAYGALIPAEALNVFPYGWINLHFSRLPQYRGAAPVQWALRDGATTTATTVFQLVPELDAGDIFDSRDISIGSDETASKLLERLSYSGASQILDVIDAISDSTARAIPQHGPITLAPKLSSEDGRLMIDADYRRVYNQFRSVTNEPGAFVEIDGNRLKILEAKMHPQTSGEPGTISNTSGEVVLNLSDGTLVLHKVQLAGKSVMSAADWFRGTRSSELRVQ